MPERNEKQGEAVYRRQSRRISHIFASSSSLQTDSSRCCNQLGDANQIVGRRGENEEPLHQGATAMAGLAQSADGLHPSEWFFDSLAADCAETIAGMSGRAPIDGRAAIGVVLRDMGSAAALAATGDELGSVIVLVAAHRAAGPAIVLDHFQRRGALRCAVGFSQPRIDDEPVAVLHHQMPHMAKLGFLAGTLAEQAGVRIGGRAMGVVLAFLAMKIPFGIASAPGSARLVRSLVTILRDKAFHRRPCDSSASAASTTV